MEEPRRKNWYAIYDPTLDPKRSKGKEVIYRYDGKAPYGEPEIIVQDPRLEPKVQGKDLGARGVRKFRPQLYPLIYEVRVHSLPLAHLVHQLFATVGRAFNWPTSPTRDPRHRSQSAHTLPTSPPPLRPIRHGRRF